MVSLSRFNHFIGVVGGAASGKDTAAGYFSEHGYIHMSSSDVVRAEIASRGLVTSRKLQTEVANEMRARHGVGYWLDRAIAQIDTTASKAVVSGLYCPGEGEWLTQQHGGTIVAVLGATEAADTQTRFDRAQARSDGSRDSLSYAEFEAAQLREYHGLETYETNLTKLIGMAQFLIRNNADLPHVRSQVDNIVNRIEEES